MGCVPDLYGVHYQYCSEVQVWSDSVGHLCQHLCGLLICTNNKALCTHTHNPPPKQRVLATLSVSKYMGLDACHIIQLLQVTWLVCLGLLSRNRPQAQCLIVGNSGLPFVIRVHLKVLLDCFCTVGSSCGNE